MCDVCCAELRRWSRSFTKTETFLTILEALLLIAFIALLTFVVLHFLACSRKEIGSNLIPPPSGVIVGDGDKSGVGDKGEYTDIPGEKGSSNLVMSTVSPGIGDGGQYTTIQGGKGFPSLAMSTVGPGNKPGDGGQGQYTNIPGEKGFPSLVKSTLDPGITCTWKPGTKTEAVTRYFEQTGVTVTIKLEEDLIEKESTSKDDIIDEVLPYLSDGEVAEVSYKQYVLALVKVRPPQDITFGCILTIVDEYWAVTAASCVEAIEEVDSLDSFVMMEDYGESTDGKTHTVADVLIHPWYEGKNKSFDFVALKSEDSLVKGSKVEVELPSALDYFLITIGEKFKILGYGGYRTVDQSPTGRRLRWVSSFVLPPRQCGAALSSPDAWAPRHLTRPAAAPHGVCGARVLCAGAVSARGAACNYCAGAPLLRHHLLLGVMSDNPHCGVACEPAVFVNIALVRPWLDALLSDDDFVV